MNMQKGLIGVYILLGILVAGLGVVGAWYTKIIQIPSLPPPGCHYQQVQCIKAPCNPILVCGTVPPNLVVTPQTTPSPAQDASREPNGSAETANWKTYASKMGGYKIQYPDNWIMHGLSKDWVDIQNQEDGYVAENVFASINTGVISIQIVDMDAFLQQLHAKMSGAQELFNSTSDFWVKISSDKEVTYSTPTLTTIGGKKAMRQTSYLTAAMPGGYPRQILVTYYVWLGNAENRVIRITFDYVEINPNKGALLKNFETILSTFKFLDQNASAETINWKTYTNSTFGYSIKFPDQYEVPVQTSREISQLGKDTSMSITRKKDGVDVIVLRAMANPQNVWNLLDYMKSDTNPLAGSWIEPTSIDGYETLLITNNTGRQYLVANDAGRQYNIIGISATSWGEEELQILSTFKFLDSNSK